MLKTAAALDAARARALAIVALAALSCACAVRPPKGPTPAYDYYAAGSLDSPTPAPTSPGLMLMGGGKWVPQAWHWFAEQSGHGHLLILRASGQDELQKRALEKIGGFASAETIIFHDRGASGDARVLDRIRHADGIFIAGGDQSNYVRYWKDSPVSAALDEHVAKGKPLGGTSAGLAIMGAHSYGAMDNGSLTSKHALAEPMGPAVTLVDGFLHLPRLATVITDTHFAKRHRLGRLIVFVARLNADAPSPGITGIGVDEDSVLCIDGEGRGSVLSSNGGHAWIVRPARAPDDLAPGKPLTMHGVEVVGVGPESALDMSDLSVARSAFQWRADVDEGRLTLR